MKCFLVIFTFLFVVDAQGWWREYNPFIYDEAKSASDSPHSMEEEALRDVLKQGIEYAVTSLGKKDGYYNDRQVKIFLPQSIQKTESLIRKNGGDKLLDNLVLSMNDTATQAAPKTTEVFFLAMNKMTIADAQEILKSDKNALTQYFKEHTNTELEHEIEPIIKEMMDRNYVSHYYKQVRAYYEKSSSSIPYKDSLSSIGKSYALGLYIPPKDLDTYVTKRAIAGMFNKIEQKEKRIRENPLVQKSKLIRDVFGSI